MEGKFKIEKAALAHESWLYIRTEGKVEGFKMTKAELNALKALIDDHLRIK